MLESRGGGQMKSLYHGYGKMFLAAALIAAAAAAAWWIYLSPPRMRERAAEDAAGPAENVPSGLPIDLTRSPKAPIGTVCLTFDDGPSPHTPFILDTLRKYGVKATFFIVGKNARLYPEFVRREKDEGHSLAVHTYSHEYKKIYSGVPAYMGDLYRTQDAIYDAAGEKPLIFRFPGGSVNKYNRRIRGSLEAELGKRGLRYFDWNVTGADSAPRVTSQDIYANIVSGVRRGRTNVVLMHDTSLKSAEALESILIDLRKRGYAFEAINAGTPAVTFQKRTPPEGTHVKRKTKNQAFLRALPYAM